METNAIYELAARPEDLSMLREEVIAVLARHDGQYSMECVGDLKKLDSFVKESQRYGNSTASTSSMIDSWELNAAVPLGNSADQI